MQVDYGESPDALRLDQGERVVDSETRGPSDLKMWAPSGTARNVGALDDRKPSNKSWKQ